MRCSQDSAGIPRSTRSIVMQSSTGHTSQQRLQPTHSCFIDMRNPFRRRHVAAIGACAVELRNRRHRDHSARRFDKALGIRVAIDMNTLMRAIPASDVAKIATDALVRMNLRDDLVIQIEMSSSPSRAAGWRRGNPRWWRSLFRPSSSSARRSCPPRCGIPSASARYKAARSARPTE